MDRWQSMLAPQRERKPVRCTTAARNMARNALARRA
jgi:hypothetical protein